MDAQFLFLFDKTLEHGIANLTMFQPMIVIGFINPFVALPASQYFQTDFSQQFGEIAHRLAVISLDFSS
jgi:hypothetical protein